MRRSSQIPARLFLLASAVLLLPGTLGAQISGIVVNQEGEPLSEARVEAWGPGSRLAARTTGAEGRFSFPARISGEVASLYASRMGYRAARVGVGPGTREYRIRLHAEPLRIEGVVAETPRDFCAAEADDEARRIWEDLARRYSDAVDTLGVATYLASAEREVTLDGLAPLELPEVGREQRGSSLHLRFGWERWIRDRGYARPIVRNGPEGGYDSWVYPPLHADFAPHFVEETFGRLHDFRLLGRTADGWTLAFCPEDSDDDEPYLRGRLGVRSDTLLAWAEWSFRTPEPDENAGGRAVFPDVREGETVFLLPTEGLFWRRLPEDGPYLLTHEKYEGWLVSGGDSVPFLPRRGGGG